MKIIGGPHSSTSDAQKGKHPVWKAFLIALLVSAASLMFFPLILFALMVAMIPGVSDAAWAIAQFPVNLFNLPLPESDSAGYTFNMAG